MIYVLAFILILFLFFFPGWWVKRVIKTHSVPRNELPGTGGELAQHLIDKFKLPVGLEPVESGDHYDPEANMVRLSNEFYTGKSLAAVAVAAHEVGHALQHHRGEALLKWRTRLAKIAMKSEKLGVVAYMAIPILSALSRSPVLASILFVVAASNMLLAVLVHLVTLPVEWDASFNKALPILEQGQYITSSEIPVVRKVLLAAALTYLAGALASMLNVWRWIAILRR